MLDWIHHPGVTKSYICLKLYGDKSSTATSKFMQKLHGRYGSGKIGFSEAELRRLEEIKAEFLDELQGKEKPGRLVAD